ncbi:MAG: phosphotransferase family protein [Alphaproteobacteria bacterium]|nr:phosphotransferase family protein [Alphaproteobacteria bacterium]
MSDQDLFTGTQPVSPGRAFDIGKLQAFMEQHVAGFSGNLDAREFKGGQSNPTYSLTAGGKRYVMRRKPPGQLLKSAHAVDREYKVMSALGATDVPVPKTYALCTDESVIGTWFYIMDHVEGRIIWGNDVPDSNPEERAAIHDSMIETFARLHAVDYQAVGLSDYGKPTDYIARTLSRFVGQYRLEETTKIPEMDWLADWLPENIPPEEPATVVHGDYKLANLVLHPTEPKVIAILDWELSTIGQPLADLAVYALYYRQGEDVPGGLRHLPLKEMGIPTEEEMLAMYCKYSGRSSVPHWEYYLAAMLFRHAQISLGILARAQKGTASSEHAMMMGKRAWPQSKAAYDIAKALAG